MAIDDRHQCLPVISANDGIDFKVPDARTLVDDCWAFFDTDTLFYLPAPVKPEVHARLQVLVDTTDGFEVAERDMRIRGFGDLSANSDKQTGDGMGFLIGRPVDVDALDQAIARLHAGGNVHTGDKVQNDGGVR